MWSDDRRRVWRRVGRALACTVGAVVARVRPAAPPAGRRTLDDQQDPTTGPAIHSEETEPMSDQTTSSSSRRPDDDGTAVRHVRVGRQDWRDAAARAKREGRGIAKVVAAFVAAYAAGEIDAPGMARTIHARPAEGQCTAVHEDLSRCALPMGHLGEHTTHTNQANVTTGGSR